jgi:hypothetical protein
VGLVRLPYHTGIVEATQWKLQAFAKIHANQVASDSEADKR